MEAFLAKLEEFKENFSKTNPPNSLMEVVDSASQQLSRTTIQFDQSLRALRSVVWQGYPNFEDGKQAFDDLAEVLAVSVTLHTQLMMAEADQLTPEHLDGMHRQLELHRVASDHHASGIPEADALRMAAKEIYSSPDDAETLASILKGADDIEAHDKQRAEMSKVFDDAAKAATAASDKSDEEDASGV